MPVREEERNDLAIHLVDCARDAAVEPDRGIRPQDLVGAITGEAGIKGDQIGAIEIADRFSIVELPEEAIEHVIAAISNCTLKGRKVIARRFVEK